MRGQDSGFQNGTVITENQMENRMNSDMKRGMI